MAYLPKNKYNKKIAGKGEFMIKWSSQPYEGEYIELSDGTYQSGTSYKQGEILVPINKAKPLNTYKVNDKGLHLDITTRKNAFDYSKLKKVIQKEHDKFQPIFFTKPFPTKKEYKKGQFRRYFCLRKNTITEYKEISKEMYEDIKDEKGTYDYNLYEVGFTPWVLTDDNTTANNKLIIRLNRAFPNIGSILFPDLTEYHLPDSLFRPKTQIEEIASDNDLKDPNTESHIPKEIPISGKDSRLEKVEKEIREEVESIARNRTKYTPPKKRTKLKLQKEYFKKAKPLSRRGSSGGSSGGGGGGY